eukprot:1136647-Pelagomonas_calceolata.AAC.1
MQSKDDKCWTSQLIQTFQVLYSPEIFEQAVGSGGAISMNDCSADLRYRLQGVWREAESVDPRETTTGLLLTKLDLLLLLDATLVKLMYPCLGIFSGFAYASYA